MQLSSVCIIGLGLMGGSLALAWQAAGVPWRVWGVDRDADTLAAAQAAGAIGYGAREPADAVAACDAVVIATPVRAILRLLPEVGRAARPGTLVMDLGSTKDAVCGAMASLPAGIEPVGGHPMCGTEQAGFKAASASLYQDRVFVLCPLPRTAAAAVDAAAHLAQAAGARPLLADPAAHDAAVATISHLPYTAAAALVQAVAAGADGLPWTLAASGFRDTTRVAASNTDVMLDALLTNRSAVLSALDGFVAQVTGLRAALAGGDEAALRAYLEAARARRMAWQTGRGNGAGRT